MTAKAVWKKTWSIISSPFRFLWRHKGLVFLILILLLVCYGGYRTVKWGVHEVSNLGKAKSEQVQPSTHVSEPASPVEADPRVVPPVGTKVGKVAVRPHTRAARINNATKLFHDANGDFITPPNYYIWSVDEDTGKGIWLEPFADWEAMHIVEGEKIRSKYANAPAYFLNYDNIIRGHPEAKIAGR